MSEFADLLAALRRGADLTRDEMRRAMEVLLERNVDENDVAAFLLALKAKGETVDEIVAAALALRARVLPVAAPARAIDTCGTGGDGADTFNISTAAAFIVAGCGVPVAKHGNRSASSRSGSSDVLAALGVRIDAPPAVIARCIREANIGFMYAAAHHPAVAHVAAVRRRLGVRTLFNLLGPLANPAGARRQLMGVYDAALTAPLARALAALGAERAWVVCGGDGLDELTTTGESIVSETRDGAVRSFIIAPEDAGLSRVAPSALKGGDPADNARALRDLLDGAPGPYRDIALFNAAAALLVAGAADTLIEGVALGVAAIDGGAAGAALERLVALSNETAP
jgi:anthranilate phosphoribosyltransferase